MNKDKTLERVVVTGMGVASPLGCEITEYWEGLAAGRSGTVSLTDEGYKNLPTRIGALVNGFNEADYFDHKEQRRMSRSSHLAIVAAEKAIHDAALLEPDINRQEIAIVLGCSIGGFSASDKFFEMYYSKGKYSPLTIPITMNVGPPSNISMRYKFQGPLMTIDAACASGPQAIGYVYNMIRNGQLHIGVTGGADSPFSPGVVAAWCALRALSERNDNPAEACRPFSGDRDGLVLGEGAGVLVLESETSALQRGRKIWAEIKGFGLSSDSHHLTQPSMEGPARAMEMALRDAQLDPEQIEYVNAHGTATLLNDPNETQAIKHVFGDHAYEIPVVSNKSALGHSIAATGALELISCILSLHHQVVTPTINYKVADPECDLDYVTDGSRSCRLENVMSNSFAFGGSNAVLIVGRYEEAH